MTQIIPYNPDRVATDQPWLSPEEREKAIRVNDEFLSQMQLVNFPIEGEKSFGLSAMRHFILTEDFEIVEEPNFFRFGMFLEYAKHRQIVLTHICDGREDESPSFKTQRTEISTVFIGMDENTLFETMVFGGMLHSVCWRNNTIQDARKCHQLAIDIVHQFNAYMKKHGRRFCKDWKRLDRFYKLGRRRGTQWAFKHYSVMEGVFNRLFRAPGDPPLPQPNLFLDLAQMFIPRETLVNG